MICNRFSAFDHGMLNGQAGLFCELWPLGLQKELKKEYCRRFQINAEEKKSYAEICRVMQSDAELC